MSWKFVAHWKSLAALTLTTGLAMASTAHAQHPMRQFNPSPAYPPGQPAAPNPLPRSTFVVTPPVVPIRVQPVFPQPAPVPPLVQQPVVVPGPVIVAQPVGVHHDRRDLERHVERTIRRQLGHCVDDVDVDIDNRRCIVEVDAEIRHPSDYHRLLDLLQCMPELRGYQIRLRVELDD
jgi:hypothetical protein